MKKVYIAMILAVIVGIFILTYALSDMPVRKASVQSVSFNDQEEEGGWTTITFYPSGYAKVEGRESGRGYTMPLKEGWYKVPDTKKLQELFDEAGIALKSYPNGTPEEPGKARATRLESTFVGVASGNKTVAFYGNEINFNSSAMDLLTTQKQNSNTLQAPKPVPLVANLSTKEDYANKKSVIN
jgi:hypothetical protein